MLDYNRRPSFADRVNDAVDRALAPAAAEGEGPAQIANLAVCDPFCDTEAGGLALAEHVPEHRTDRDPPAYVVERVDKPRLFAEQRDQAIERIRAQLLEGLDIAVYPGVAHDRSTARSTRRK